jgi:hypothetical protein
MNDLNPSLTAQLGAMREQLSQQLARRGPDDPFVEHLRWQIGCLERRLRHPADGHRFGAAHPAPAAPRLGQRGPQPG